MLMACSVPYWDILRVKLQHYTQFQEAIDILKLIKTIYIITVMTTAHALFTASKKTMLEFM